MPAAAGDPGADAVHVACGSYMNGVTGYQSFCLTGNRGFAERLHGRTTHDVAGPVPRPRHSRRNRAAFGSRKNAMSEEIWRMGQWL